MILLINLLSASESKAQMVVPHGTVSVMVLVTPLVTLCSLRLLSTPRLCSTPLEFAVSGCSCLGCQLGSVSVNIPGLDLLLQRSLSWDWSAKVFDSDLLPQRS